MKTYHGICHEKKCILCKIKSPFTLAAADFFGATFVGLTSVLGAFAPDFFAFLGLSDSDADEAELRVVLVVGKAFVLGLLEGTFLLFFLDFSSAELLE